MLWVSAEVSTWTLDVGLPLRDAWLGEAPALVGQYPMRGSRERRTFADKFDNVIEDSVLGWLELEDGGAGSGLVPTASSS